MNEEHLVSMQEAKSCFSKLGWALFTMTLATILLQLLMGVVASVLYVLGLDLLSNPWFVWAASFLPLYAVGIPVYLLLVRAVPAQPQPQSKLTGSRFFVLLLMCFPVMSLGNLIGSLLSAVLSGGTAQNSLESYLTEGGVVSLLMTVIVAPVVEEYVFRKQLLDRCARYGEKPAMVFSALAFGLFHMNFYQFFYAFGVGLILAYVYLRTRNLRYPILMHMILNFMGSAVPLWVISHLDVDALANLNPYTIDQETLATIAPMLLLYLGYMLLDLMLVIVGLVVGIVKRKTLRLSPAPDELPQEGRWKTVYGNVSFILFAVTCAIMFVLAL